MSLHGLMNRRSDWERLERADKRKLLAIIARALLVLYRSSWWESSELLDYVTFHHDTTSSIPDHLGPHILHFFEQSKSPEQRSDTIIHQHPVFLQYGLLLMEFEYGKTLDTGRGPRFGEPAEPYLVLKGQLEDNRIRRSVSDTCRHIGKACLYFDEHLAAFDHRGPRNDGNLKFRAVIYKLILKPLLQEIRKDFPDENLDDLDLPNWSNEQGIPRAKFPRHNRTNSISYGQNVDWLTRSLPTAPLLETRPVHAPRRSSHLKHFSSATDTKAHSGKPVPRSGFSYPERCAHSFLFCHPISLRSEL